MKQLTKPSIDTKDRKSVEVHNGNHSVNKNFFFSNKNYVFFNDY